MLLWLILGCSENKDSQSSTKGVQTTQAPSVDRGSGDNAQNQKPAVGRSGQQKSPSQYDQNGPRAGNGPKGPPPNGKMGAPGLPSQGRGPNGTAQMKQPEPFHATVAFDWVDESLNVENSKSIIWISLDTVHAKRMSIYGGPAQVPNLNAFTYRAVQFNEAISHFPETALSHWTMMSSVLPEVHGNVPANGGSIYTGPTLADIAKFKQYATGGFIGGVTMTDQASGFGRSFDVYDDQFTFSFEDMSRDGTEVTERTKAWIQQQKGSKYFAFAHYFDAHFPYTPTKNLYDPEYTGVIDGTDAVLRPYRDGQKKPSARDVEHVLALYDAEITELDAKIAPLLELADENTIVVVTSDHGESFSHDYYFNHRAGLWDEVTHVPLLIGGGGIKEKILVDPQIGLIDVLPTVLDMAGLPKDKRFMGVSRQDLIADITIPSSDIVYSITDPWMPSPQFASRTQNHKWIHGLKEELVYNLHQDPSEQVSLVEIPSVLKDSKDVYRSLIDSYTQWQTQSPRKRQISDAECQRLMALGYTTCGQ